MFKGKYRRIKKVNFDAMEGFCKISTNLMNCELGGPSPPGA